MLAIACSSQSPDAVDAGAADSDAGATADSTLPTGADADAQAEVASDPGPTGPEAECLAMVLPCWKFSWVNGNCVQVPINGPNCEEVPTPCETPKGSACARTSANPCFESSGTCSEEGFCVASPKPGAPCSISTSPCGMGICTDQGKCLPVAVGEPCATQVGVCQVGRCDAKGACTAESLPEGTTCTVAAPKTCQSTSGKCDAAAKCVADADTGAVCKIAAPKDCEGPSGKCDAAAKCVADVTIGAKCKVGGTVCGTGTCNSSGGCDAQVFAAAGTSCGINVGCGVPTCDGSGNCLPGKAAVGTPCGNDTSISCAKYACNAAGQCALAPNPGAACSALAEPQEPSCSLANKCSGGVCGSEIGKCEFKFFKGKACWATSECTVGVCSEAGSCQQVPAAAGKTCKSTSACTVGVCNSEGLCTQVPIDDGVPCGLGPGSDPACASGACLAGKCAFVPNTGKSCGASKCKAGVCSDKGICEYSPTPGKACGPADECTANICDAAGECILVPKPGASCGSGPCHSGTCSAEGKCDVKVKVGATCQDKGLCGDGVCNAQGQCVSPAFPKKSECHVSTSSVLGECWAGVLDPSGKCNKVAKVGAACGCWVSPCSMGTCQADGSCLQKPSKPAGTPCSSDCVKNGVCTSAGKCSGTVAVGNFCDDGEEYKANYYCRHPRCQADGDCAPVFEPAGTSCADAIAWVQPVAQWECGLLDKCDGQGHCIAKNPAKDGTSCSLGDPCSPGRTCFAGHCLSQGNKPDMTSCAVGCVVGVCKAGWCEKTGLASDVSCDDGNSCTQDTCCGIGSHTSPLCDSLEPAKCSHIIDAGKVCLDGSCTTGMCDSYSGSCAVKTFVSGKSCGTNACGENLVCFGQECQVTSSFSVCQDNNPCTADSCSYCGCSHTPSASLEGYGCAPGAHCLKGNCVPD